MHVNVRETKQGINILSKIDSKSVKTMGNPDGEGAALPFSSHLKNMIELPVWWLLTSD